MRFRGESAVIMIASFRLDVQQNVFESYQNFH